MVLILVVMVLGFGVVSVQAQQATPTPQDPADVGVISWVSRSFVAQNVSFDSILALSTLVWEYEDTGLASEGMHQIRSKFLGVLKSDSGCPEDMTDFSDLKEVSAPQIADESLALAGSVGEEDGIQGQVTILLFREAQFVYVLVGAAGQIERSELDQGGRLSVFPTRDPRSEVLAQLHELSPEDAESAVDFIGCLLTKRGQVVPME